MQHIKAATRNITSLQYPYVRTLLTFNLKRGQTRDRVGVFNVHCIYASGAGAFAKTLVQAGQLLGRALGQDFDRGVGIVADPACDLEDVGFALDEPAEADALNAAADEEALRYRVIG